MIKKLIATLPEYVDLTNASHLELVDETVDSLLLKYSSLSKLDPLETELINRNDTSLVFILLAIKIAKSKIYIRQISEPLTVSVVFAVYKEHNRIRNSTEHQHGEDFLLRKLAQLENLFKDYPNIDWELIVVDDGYPNFSDQIA